MKVLAPKTYPEILDLIQGTESIDSILSAGVAEDGTIFCLASFAGEKISVKIGDTIETRTFVQSSGIHAAAQFSQKQDTPNQIATNLQKLGDPIVGGWLRQIEQMLATSDDLETAREALFQLYPDLDSTDLAEQMADATAAASMAGFWEAQKDADN